MSDIKQISLNGTVYDLRDAEWIGAKTNCITEIPQDINLTLSSGTLTLKAGSKVYVPNGSDVFDTLTIASDLSTTQTTDGVYLVAITSAGTSITTRLLANSASGAGATTTSGFAYDTTTNKINNYSSEGTIGAQYSFPIAIVTVSGGAISSIDQVFNGFGYIGSSRFFLPGVKVLIPNGLNSDGTLNNIPYTQTTVNVYTWSSSANTKNFCTLGEAIDNFAPYYEQTTQPTTSGLWYNPKTNLLLRSTDNGATWVQRKAAVYAEVMLSSGTITSFSPKTVFHAVDYSDWNEHRVVAFQAPTSANGYKGYRKYSDGYIEQWGSDSNVVNTSPTITLPVPMANATYQVFLSGYGETLTQGNKGLYVVEGSKTTAAFQISGANILKADWMVKGMAA